MKTLHVIMNHWEGATVPSFVTQVLPASEQIFGMSVTVQVSTGGVYEDQ